MRGEVPNGKSRVVLNILVPIAAGAMVYLMFSPSVLFLTVAGLDILKGSMQEGHAFVRLMRCYLPDMLWGYSLVFALFLAMGRNRTSVVSTLFLAMVFSILIEGIQLLPEIPGTFDLYDIGAEFFAEGLAFLIISGKNGKEKGYGD